MPLPPKIRKEKGRYRLANGRFASADTATFIRRARQPDTTPWRNVRGRYSTREFLAGDSTVNRRPIATRRIDRIEIRLYRVKGLANEHIAREIMEREAEAHPNAKISYSVGVGKGRDREWIGSTILSPERAKIRFRTWHRTQSGARALRQAEDLTFEGKNRRAVIWYEIKVRIPPKGEVILTTSYKKGGRKTRLAKKWGKK